jgi:tricorn protease
MKSRFTALTMVLMFLAGAAGAVEPHGGMLRYPDVSATHIAFLYANDLWLVPKGGGMAVPLASPPGRESFPRFSPDGKMIAFMGNYDGNSDIYTVPVSGGVPFRVTHHPVYEVLTDWTNDGRLIFFARGMKEYPRAQELFSVPATGGLPEKMPVPYGADGTLSDDGVWLAYTPHSRDTRTWKRYRGGMATDIWLFNLKTHESRKITEWDGTDTQPMWHGDKVYYLSDAGDEHRLNIWVYDVNKGDRRQVTHYEDYDVKWPSIGPGTNGEGEIVFQYGADLYLLNLGSEEAARVRVTIPGDRPKIRPRMIAVKDFIFSSGISSSGKRVVIEARGDIWTLPAKKGALLDLTRTSGVAERNPAWSPDGRWIAYFSDENGENYELYVTQSDGRGETRRLTSLGRGYLYDPVWSPDSKKIAFWDQNGRLFVHDIDKRKTRQLDQTPANDRHRVSWSSDSRWLTYARGEGMIGQSCIWIYDVAKGRKHKVTSGMFNDSWPTFDREGKYLFFASNREFSSPIYEDLGTTWVYAGTERLYVVPLKKDAPSPLAPENDMEEWNGEKKKSEKKNGDKGKKGKKAKKKKEEKATPVVIDMDGFEHRAVQLPVERGKFALLNVNDKGQLVYARMPVRGGRGKPSIKLFDLEDEKKEEKTVLEGTGSFSMSSDGKKLLVRKEGKMAVIDARPKQKMKDFINTADMKTRIDPRAEWRQIFTEAWRIQRDFFYDPNMHGLDWKKVRERYEAMLADCASREDVSYVIREMISELNVGHAYYFGGDVEKAPKESVGMLGCDFELADGAYRIARIIEGAPWDVDGRGPLSQPGVDVEEGDYLLAVNGVPMDTSKDPWAAFQGLAGKTVTLTLSSEPKMSDKARNVVVKLLASERKLRYRAWVEKNRAYVEKKSKGAVGYIYVPNTGIDGQNELVRQFFGQLDKKALIIDERWNGGGQIPTRFVELLNRPIANYWALRDTKDDFPWPPDAHQGPKCMLINGLAGSGGDYFPYWFKEVGLGKLIGTRTWGGLVGISGNPRLIDGGYTSAPTFAFFTKDGKWGIEGHGVDPDIPVLDDPALMVHGEDPQLDAAIDEMLKEIKEHPYVKPPRPSYPDKSGM